MLSGSLDFTFILVFYRFQTEFSVDTYKKNIHLILIGEEHHGMYFPAILKIPNRQKWDLQKRFALHLHLCKA